MLWTVNSPNSVEYLPVSCALWTTFIFRNALKVHQSCEFWRSDQSRSHTKRAIIRYAWIQIPRRIPLCKHRSTLCWTTVCEHLVRKITWLPWRHRFRKVLFSNFFTQRNENPGFSHSSCLKSVFEKLRFRDGLVWTVGLTVEIFKT